MRLVRGEDVRLRLGLPSTIDTIVAASDNATEEATLMLESDLRTTLLQADYADYWLPSASDRTIGQLKFKLTAGFVTGTVAAGTGLSRADALMDESLTDKIIVNEEMGTFILDDASIDRFISVRYTAGFPLASGANPDQLFDLSDAPDWLIKAAELKSIAIMADAPELDNKEGKLIDGRSFARQYDATIVRHIRYVPDSRLPLG